MISKQKGFSALYLLLLIVTIGIIGGTGWYVYRSNQSINETLGNTNKSTFPTITKTANNASAENKENASEQQLSSNWLLRESEKSSIKVPDGFEILVPAEEKVTFILPDTPQGTLKYTKGTKAKIVGEPHKHFELGLLTSYNLQGYNDRGTYLRSFKTYSGLPVDVKFYEKLEDPNGVDFAKGTKHLKYRVIKGDNYFNVDYAYLGNGIVEIIDEMVKTVDIKE